MADLTAFHERLGDNPVIAAVKSREGLEKALKSDVNIIFTLFGTVTDIGGLSRQIKDAGKLCMVHLDLIDGLAPREVSVDFVAANTQADGILSTKQGLVKTAAARGLLTIQRFFLLDSMAMENIRKQYASGTGAIEVLPGLMPKMIRKVQQAVPVPVIAGGLISEKEDVIAALSAGACAVSTTNEEMWFL